MGHYSMQVRDPPGFETVLKTSPFDTLPSVGARGPVIIISHGKWRSNIIIFFP